MTQRDPYNVLGIERSATQVEIRQAFLLRSKLLHPDRFNPVSQPAEWKLANELFQELSEAYQALRNIDKKEKSEPHNEFRSNRPTTNSSQTNPFNSAEAAKTAQRIASIKSGICWFKSLPRSIQNRISDRVSGVEKAQISVATQGVWMNYFLVLVSMGWIVYIFNQTSGPKWGSNEISQNIFWCIGMAALCAYNFYRILAWHSTPLKHFLIITPIYVIRTEYDKIHYWPIWEVSKFQGTHHYVNGVYQRTSITIGFGKNTQVITVRSSSAYEKMLEIMKVFQGKAAAAQKQNDAEYFHSQNDFRDFNPGAFSPKPIMQASHKYGTVVITFLLFGVSLLISKAKNDNSKHRYPLMASSPSSSPPPIYPRASTPKATPPPQIFNEPEQTLPQSGEIIYNGTSELVAPFEVRPSIGSNYLVKLYSSITNREVISVFVRGGERTRINVPLGSYQVKYASGDKWYGYEYLFGLSTNYSRAKEVFRFDFDGTQYTGYTITLYQVANGNLQTESIPKSSF